MQENEFEKQLKRAMEDFRITPPASAWENISRRLDKKRRPKLPFIFLLAVGLVVTGYFVYRNYEKQSPQQAGIVENDNKSTNPNADGASLSTPNNSPGNNTGNTANLSSTNKNNSKTKNSHTGQYSLKQFKPTTDHSTARSTLNNNVTADTKHYNLADNTQKNDKDDIAANNAPVNNNSKPVEQPAEVTPNQTPVVTNNDLENSNTLKPDSIANTVAEGENNAVVSSKQKTIKPGAINSKWRFEINGFYGKSNAINELVSFDKKSLLNSFSPGAVAGNSDTSFYSEHPYTASDAYQFGITVQKKIIKNGFLSTGLNYIHLSTKSDISTQVNSTYIIQNFNRDNNFYALSSYYQPGSKSTFINKYNFIELPVYFQQEFFPANKLSFSYNAGFSIRQLLSSDALVYNQYNNIYFSQDDLLRKTQLQLLAGLNLKYNVSKTASIYLGPQFSYSLSNMLKNDNNGKFHFITYGLQTGLVLQKK